MVQVQEAGLISQMASPHHSGRFLAEWMDLLGVAAAPIQLDPDRIGWVSRKQAADQPSRMAYELSQGPAPEVEAGADLEAAAMQMAESGPPLSLVTRGGKVIGWIDLKRMIRALSLSRDPITGLPWSDRLRAWGRDQLAARREITLIFIDLNDFGRYNKTYGHIYGDRVLQALAQRVLGFTEPDSDVFVRYGGDEFVLASLRTREEAERLAADIQAEPLTVEGVAEPVRFSYGISGGKRTKERLDVHYSSTLDNLINLASQDCLSRKPKKAGLPAKKESLRPEEALREALHAFRQRHPHWPTPFGAISYQLAADGSREVIIESESGKAYATAPLTNDLRQSLLDAMESAAKSA